MRACGIPPPPLRRPCRCRYLEEAGCASICINSCKVPTQEFFAKDMCVRHGIIAFQNWIWNWIWMHMHVSAHVSVPLPSPLCEQPHRKQPRLDLTLAIRPTDTDLVDCSSLCRGLPLTMTPNYDDFSCQFRCWLLGLGSWFGFWFGFWFWFGFGFGFRCGLLFVVEVDGIGPGFWTPLHLTPLLGSDRCFPAFKQPLERPVVGIAPLVRAAALGEHRRPRVPTKHSRRPVSCSAPQPGLHLLPTVALPCAIRFYL
jgi:hypothetical protein